MTAGDRPLVLVVDDDEDIVGALVDALSDEGYEVAAARDGLEALEYLRSSKRPNLILLDWMMPRCDGPTFRRHQREDAALADIPVVLLTAAGRTREGTPEIADLMLLRKPVALDDLLKIVASMAR